ncbi:Uu.00g057900.m01.CDS01 [Anthostomella pinea]|uniref:Uu.00g057900.m01.CDS01 n=1 Tax=Anthostomella pinea TaxID=933095 RepID=A0AAI8YMC1_9PEZI|nr:Uu.00g057900.m01.CDS01 [Anthostomella pinea]
MADTTTTPPHQQALARLQPLQPVLWGFAHRNRNQHRYGFWWGAFGMLRRSTDKLVDDLLSSLPPSSRSSVAANDRSSAKAKVGKKRKRAAEDGTGKARKGNGGDGGASEAATDRRASWLLDVLVPRCYAAFSQLTADNQFAPLGVVLLAALAQVRAACVCLVGETPTPTPPPQEDGRPSAAACSSSSSSASADVSKKSREGAKASTHSAGVTGVGMGEGAAAHSTGGAGGGAAISREDVAQAEKLLRRNREKETPKDQAGAEELCPLPAEVRSRSKGIKSRKDGEFAGESGEASSRKKEWKAARTKPDAKGNSDEEARPAKKKKKKAKKGDEFDDLFKGLF